MSRSSSSSFIRLCSHFPAPPPLQIHPVILEDGVSKMPTCSSIGMIECNM